jgi:endonuclease/exonuclease/phosphatase family metal-dependent hydrolase
VSGPGATSLRLATVNLFSGRSAADGLVDHDRMAAAVAALDADVLALQEVDHAQPRSGGADQARLVAEAAGAAAHRFVPLVAGTPGVPGWTRADAAAGPPPGPSYGIALAVRRPVSSWHVLTLDPPPGRWPIPIPSRPPRVLWISDEPRAAVAAVLPEPRLVVACTHLSFVPGVNARQLRRVRAWLTRLAADAGAPLVLLGDLNLPGRLPARLTGWTPLISGATYPAAAPRAQLDHVLARGLDRAAVRSGRVVQLAFSDHRAPLVELDVH